MRLILSFLFFSFSFFVFPAKATMMPQSFILSNGSEVYTLPSNALPIVMMQMTFKWQGSISDEEGKEGRAHLAAMMLKEGAGDWSAKAFRTELENKAIELNAGAGRDHFTLTLRCLKQHLPAAFSMLETMFSKPHFDVEQLEKRRSELLIDLKQAEQSPNWIAAKAMRERYYPGHRYAIDVEGTADSIKGLSVIELKDWWKKLSGNQLVVSATGAIEPKDLKEKLEHFIQALPSQRNIKQESPSNVHEHGKSEAPLVEQMEVPQTVALMQMPAPMRHDDDFYAAYVMNYILGGGGLTSRLSQVIRQQHGLAYYAGSQFIPAELDSRFLIQFSTRNEAAFEAVKLAKEVLSRAAEEGFTAEEVQNAIDYITGSFPLSLDGLDSQLAYLHSMQVNALGKDYLQKRNEYFRAVTLEAVNRVAQNYLAKPSLIVLVGNPE